MRTTLLRLTLFFICGLFFVPDALAQLSGSYTINPSGSGGKNYKTFNAAVTALNSAGVSGPVVFNVSKATYTEQVVLNYVSGSSATNTVTFKGTDSSQTILRYNATQYESVVKVNAASNFVFQGLTIQSTNTSYGYGIHITAGAKNIKVNNCILKVSTSPGADCLPLTVSGVSYSTNGANGSDIAVTHTIFYGGYYGVNLRGTSNSLQSNNFSFDHCQFTNQYYMGLASQYIRNLSITYCTIKDQVLSYAYGLYILEGSASRIEFNKINPGRFGIYCYLENYYNRSDSSVIQNNEITDFDDVSYQSGIYSYYDYNLRIYHNSIRVAGSVDAAGYNCVYLSGPYNHTVLNNNFASYGNSSCFYMGAGTLGSTVIDYNNYYSSTGNLIYWQSSQYNTLSVLKSTVTTQNQHSVSKDPWFTSSNYLFPTSPALNNSALKGVSSKDLNGYSRPKSPDPKPDMGAYEFYIDPVDIDIIDIYRPLIAKTGLNPISITIANNGSGTLKDTLHVSYRINGGSWVKGKKYYSGLTPNSTDTLTFSKRWNVTTDGSYQVCVAINPMFKGDPDSLTGDTFCSYKCVGLKGNFVIDPSGAGDFKTFTAAISSINCGIAGPVKFTVKPGTYNERFTITSILGASATNTITFSGVSADSVTLVSAGTNALPATIRLEGASYVTFENIKIRNTGNLSAVGVWLKETAHHNTIKNCIIEMDSTSTSSGISGILSANAITSGSWLAAGNLSHHNSFIGNTITGGSYGISINGQGAYNTSTNNIVLNNTIQKTIVEGIGLSYASNNLLRGNQITKPNSIAQMAIRMYFCDKDTIDKNDMQGGRIGLYIYYENSYNQNTSSLIANNMASNMLDPNYQGGMFIYYCYNTNVYHNSIWTQGTYVNTSYCGMSSFYNNNCNIKNNSIKATNGNYCFVNYYGTVNIGSVDYNNYYSDGVAKYYWDGLTFTDLKTWKTVVKNFNTNSKEGDPSYTSTSDLHASGIQLNNSALKSVAITSDFDGEKRPKYPDVKVDIGADEYYVSQYDIDLFALDSPFVPVIGNNEIKITLYNAGLKGLKDDTVRVSYTINSGSKVTEMVIIDTLAPSAYYHYTFATKWKVTTSATYTVCAIFDTLYLPDPDTLITQQKCRTVCPGFKGTYTIDASGAGDFKTFRGAINSLQCGITGNVTFNVKNGSYFERIVIPEIKGTSSKYKVKFIGESQKGVKLFYTGKLDSAELLHLKGADYVHFENMSLTNFGQYYSVGIRLSHIADHNTFKNINVTITEVYVGARTIPIELADNNETVVGNSANYNSFTNCRLTGGYYGIYAYGIGTTSLCYGNSFDKMQIKRSYYYPIFGRYEGGMKITNCDIDSVKNNYMNIYLYMCSQSLIKGNKLGNAQYSLYLLYENYYFHSEISQVSNNIINRLGSTGTNYGAYLYYGYNYQFYHNTVNHDKGTGVAVAFFYGSGHDMRNNCISKTTNAELFQNTSGAFINIDYNNYYAGTTSNYATYNGTSYSSFSAWQSGVNGFNKHSRDGDPNYISTSDLHIQPKTTQLANWGANTLGVTTDIDGDIRNPSNPDVGADEYSDFYDVGVSYLYNPVNSCKLGKTESITFSLKNFGSIQVPSGQLVPFLYQIDAQSIILDTVVLTANLNSGDSIQLTFKQKANFSTSRNYNLSVWTDVSNDPKRSNDTLKTVIKSFEEPVAGFSTTNNCSVDGTVYTSTSTVATSSITGYKWSFGDGNTSTSTTPKHAFASSGSYSSKLVVTTAQGCKDSITNSVSVLQKPTSSFTSLYKCLSDSTQFTNTSSIVSQSGATFNWIFGDGNTSTKVNTKHKYSTSGNYTVSLIATSKDGCKDTSTSVVGISAAPDTKFSFTDICLGDNGDFKDQSTLPGGFTTNYAWTFGDGGTASSANSNYKYSKIGSFNVVLTTTLSNGCSDTAQRTVHVYSKPEPDFIADNMCFGPSMPIIDNASIQLDTIKTWLYRFGDGSQSTLENPTHSYASAGTYTISQILVSVNGCADSISKTVVIHPKPITSYALTTECQSDSTMFTNSSTLSAGNFAAYNWTFGDGFSSSKKNPGHLYINPGTFTTQLIVYSDSGCSDTLSKTATVKATPSIGFTNANLCLGDDYSPTNSSSISAGSISGYKWYFGDATTSTSASPTHTYLAKGNYTVKLVATSNLGCKDSLSKSISVDVTLVPSYSYSNNCVSDSIRFSNLTNVSCGSVTGYIWRFGDGKKSTLKNPSHLYSAAGNYNVTLVVTQSGGLKDSTTKTISVDPMPSPAWSVSSVCAATSTTFNNLSTVSSGSISSYEWQFGDGSKSSATSPSHAYATHGSFSVKLLATSNKGCKDSTSKSFTVYELPTSDFTATTVCLGKDVQFTNKASISSGTLTYNWSFGDGFNSTKTNPAYKYTSSGNYTVTLMATSNHSCVGSSSKTVTVNPNPSIDFAFSNECINNPVSFTNKSTITTGTLSYKWKFGDGDSSATTNPSHSYTSAGSYTVDLTATSNKGCVSTGSKTVSSYATPSINFSIPASCSGTNLSFVNTSSISTGSLTYTWDFGDGGKSSSTNPTHNYSATGNYTVKLIGTSNNGCKDSISKAVKVYDIPSAKFSVTNSCLADSIYFSNTSTIASGTMTYKWSFGNGKVSTSTNPTVKYASAASYNVKLVATSNWGCKDSTTTTLVINPTPVSAFSTNNVCLGVVSDFNNSSSISSGTLTYFWDFDNGLASTTKNPSVTFGTAKTYQVKLRVNSSKGCVDSITKAVTIYPIPKPLFNLSKTCLGDSTKPVNGSTISSGTMSYKWDFGNGTTDINRNPTAYFSAVQSYTIKLKVSSGFGCKDSISKSINVNAKPKSSFSFANVCEGVTAVFTNKSSISTGSYTSVWKFGDNKQSTSKSVNHLYANPATYRVSLVVQSDSGCVDSMVDYITINAKPQVSVTGNNACASDAISFSNTTSLSKGTISGYNWKFGDGFTSTISKPSHTYSAAGTYNVQMIAVSDSSCSDTGKMTVSIYDNPKADFSASNVCFGDSIKPVNSSTISSGSISAYDWNFGDGGTSTASNPVHYYSTMGSYSLKLITESNNGCKDSVSKTIVVDNKISASFNANIVCIGQTTTFTNTTNISCGTVSSYLWDFGDGGSSTKASPQYKYASAGSYTVKLIVSQKGGLKDTATQTVVVGYKPNVGFTLADICAKDSAKVASTSSITSGSIAAYQWNFGDGSKATGNKAVHYYSTNGNYQVSLKATSNYGCSDSTTKTLTVNEIPKSNFSAPSSVCAVDSFKATNASSISSGSLSYLWNFGDGKTSTATDASHLYSSSGTYLVSLTSTSAKGCKATNSLMVNINATPQAIFSAVSACQNQNLVYTDKSTISSGRISAYSYNFGDGFTATTKNATHKFASAGSYWTTFKVTSDSGCSDTSMKKLNAWPVPKADFIAPNVCFGDDFTPTNKSSITGGTIASYKWTFGDGGSSTSASPTYNYATKGNYSVKLVVNSAHACKDSLSKSISVDNNLVPGFNTSNVCEGDSVKFSNTTNTSCGTITAYLWQFGDGKTATSKDVAHLYASPGTYKVNMIITKSGGIKDTASQTITVYPAAKIGWSVSSVCQGTDASFNNTTSISSGSITDYIWSFGDASKSSTTSPKHNYSAYGSFGVQLLATTDKGCKDSITKSLTIYETPVADFSANDACLGGATQFKNNTTFASGTPTYTWDFGDGFSSTATSPKYTYTAGGTYTVKLTVKSSNNCSDVYQSGVKIYNAPSVAFVMKDTCVLNAVNLKNKTVVSSGTATYRWNFGDGNTSTATQPVYAYAKGGKYIIKLVATSSEGCKDSVIQQITIFDKPTAAFGYTSTCPDQQVNFANNSTPSTGLSYLWTFSAKDTSMRKSPLYTFSNPSFATALLQVKNSNGCSDTISQKVAFQSVPKAAFAASNVCEKDNVKFTNQSTLTSGTAAYQWQFGDGNTSNSTDPVHFYTDYADKEVTLVVSSDKGCKDSVTQFISFDKKPTADFIVTNACLGKQTSFGNFGDPDVETFTWYFGDATNVMDYEPLHTYTTSGKYNVSLVSDNGKCQDSVAKTITVAVGPQNLDFDFDDACEGNLVKFTNNSTNPNLTYNWQFFDGTYSTLKSPTKFYKIPGNYTIGFTATEGDCADSVYKVINIYPYGDSSFTYSLAGPLMLQFANTDSSQYDYEWTFGDGNKSTEQSPLYQYATDGVYNVTLTVTTPNGCQNTSTQKITVGKVSVEGPASISNGIFAFPNPFSQQATVGFETTKAGFVTFELYDMLGKRIQSFTSDVLSAGKYSYLFDDATTTGGVYTLVLRVDDVVTTHTLLKNK